MSERNERRRFGDLDDAELSGLCYSASLELANRGKRSEHEVRSELPPEILATPCRLCPAPSVRDGLCASHAETEARVNPAKSLFENLTGHVDLAHAWVHEVRATCSYCRGPIAPGGSPDYCAECDPHRHTRKPAESWSRAGLDRLAAACAEVRDLPCACGPEFVRLPSGKVVNVSLVAYARPYQNPGDGGHSAFADVCVSGVEGTVELNRADYVALCEAMGV